MGRLPLTSPDGIAPTDGYSIDVVDVAPFIAGPIADDAHALAGRLRDRLGSARVWHVNSTATGGGVAELLNSGIGRHNTLGVPTSWLVSNAPEEFFELTKRLHHGMHGAPGVGTLTTDDVEHYRLAGRAQAEGLLAHVRAGDLVVLHDPQTLGAAPRLLAAGARVVWRSHVGTTSPNAWSDATWELLRPYLDGVPLCVFTVAGYAPPFVAADRVRVIRPSIDPYAPKNRELSTAEIAGLLARVGLTDGPVDTLLAPVGRVLQDRPLATGTPYVLQLSRWDPLKDMAGVMAAFVAHVAGDGDAHLVLAGPDPADVADDPEGVAVFEELVVLRDRLAPQLRARVHIVMLSLRDTATNALVVNALQRGAAVISQKSLQEGFGLTITEAMWKGRPVVATRVGGIPSQIDSAAVGVLVDDPRELAGYGAALVALLADPQRANALGVAARERVAAGFLSDRELVDYLRLYEDMLAAGPAVPAIPRQLPMIAEVRDPVGE